MKQVILYVLASWGLFFSIVMILAFPYKSCSDHVLWLEEGSTTVGICASEEAKRYLWEGYKMSGRL